MVAQKTAFAPAESRASAARRRVVPVVQTSSTSSTRIVGVVVSDLRNPFNEDVASGVLAQAAELGYKGLINTSERQRKREEDAIESFLELRVDGLILATSRIDDRTIGRASRSVPVVVLCKLFRVQT